MPPMDAMRAKHTEAATPSRVPLLAIAAYSVALLAAGLSCQIPHRYGGSLLLRSTCPLPILGQPFLLLGLATLLPALVGIAYHRPAGMTAGLRSTAPTEESPLVRRGTSSAVEADKQQSYILAYLFMGHFLCGWGDRMWQFAVPVLFMDVFVDSLLPSAAFSLSLYSCCIVLLPSIGSWIDRVDRRHAVLTRLAYQNAAIVASCSVLIYLLVHTAPASGSAKDREPPRWNDPVVASCFGGILLLGAVGQLMSSAQSIAVEKDWVVVISKGFGTDAECDDGALAKLNTRMRRIDLLCKILAPTAFGLVLQLLPDGTGSRGAHHDLDLFGLTAWFEPLDASTKRAVVGALVLGLWNALSFPLEWIFHSRVYAAHPYLASKLHEHADGTRHAHPKWADSKHTHPSAPTQSSRVDAELALLAQRSADDPHTFRFSESTGPVVLGDGTTRGGTSLLDKWSRYARHRIFLASLSYCLLYGTVLDNGALMTSYLQWRGVNTSVLGLSRGIGAVFGLLGTVLFPALYSCTNSLVRSGLYSIWLFWILLTPCAAIFFVTGESLYSDYGVMGAMILSRVGLWAFDLANTQIMQEWVEENERGTLNAMQIATYQFMFIAMQLLGMFYADPRNFEVLVFASTGVVLSGALLYSIWAAKHDVGPFALVDELGNVRLRVRG